MTRKLCLLLILALFLPALARAQAPPPDPKLNDALWDAVRKGDAAAVKSLLEKGADVNAKGRYQQTPLFKAAERGDLEVVRLLLERGADLTVRDTFYQATPITWALDKGHVEVVRALVEKGSPGVDDVLSAGVNGAKVELVKIALAKGGLSAPVLTNSLALAAARKNAEIAELLRQAGAKPPFQVDAETLKTYEGSYKNEGGQELKVALNPEGYLTVTTPGGSFLLAASDATTFSPIEFGGLQITFNVEGGKVAGFTLKQGQGAPQVYKRAAAK